jgi:CheY-like chemotaxis protein
MMPASHNELLRQGIAAAKQGDRARARALLLEATELEPGYELAWLWLASVAEDRQDTAYYLERALAINPDDERALSWLTHVREQLPQVRKHWKCPLCLGESLVEVEKCPSCKAVTSLRDLDRLLENDECDREALRGAVARLESLRGEEVSFEVHYHLGLAYLNLKRVYEGITRLRVASQLRPEDDVLRDRVAELTRRREEHAAAVAQLERAATAASGKRVVLVVDDSPTVLKIVGMALERQGHEVLVAGNAMQALAKLDEATPDLILLDITMPHMDGYQLCKLIKANPLTADIPVVMLSGKDGFFDKVRGRLAGSTDYITKPFDPSTLVEAVERHCRREA